MINKNFLNFIKYMVLLSTSQNFKEPTHTIIIYTKSICSRKNSQLKSKKSLWSLGCSSFYKSPKKKEKKKQNQPICKKRSYNLFILFLLIFLCFIYLKKKFNQKLRNFWFSSQYTHSHASLKKRDFFLKKIDLSSKKILFLF